MTLYFSRCLYSVGDSQPDDESESGDIFDAVDHLGQLTLKVADVCLETVRMPHLDGKKVVVVLLEHPNRRIIVRGITW